MRFKAGLILCGALSSASAAVNDYGSTNLELLGQIDITVDTYYFQSADLNWSIANCPNARYAYVREDDDGAKATLAAALSAKMAGIPVSFAGLCGDSNGDDRYLRIQRIIVP